MAGRVIWVGRSSLDVLVQVLAEDQVVNRVLLSSIFTYVARDRQTRKAVQVNQLRLEAEYERALFGERGEAARRRKLPRESAAEPSQDAAMRALLDRGNVLLDMPALADPRYVLMRSTSLENSFVCQPQSSNTAGRVFGGFLMHRAFDLALATCYTFAGAYPRLVQVDRIVFRQPVDIGDLVRIKSKVVLALQSAADSESHHAATVAVEVFCQVVKPERCVVCGSLSCLTDYAC
jgi:acyl-coenzyme A thioesterase 9